MKNIGTGIAFGVIGGLLTFIFGGWSVAVIGALMGVGLGLGVAGRFERKEPLKIALAVLPTALVAGGILVALSLVQNNYIQEAYRGYQRCSMANWLEIEGIETSERIEAGRP